MVEDIIEKYNKMRLISIDALLNGKISEEHNRLKVKGHPKGESLIHGTGRYIEYHLGFYVDNLFCYTKITNVEGALRLISALKKVKENDGKIIVGGLYSSKQKELNLEYIETANRKFVNDYRGELRYLTQG